MIKYTKESGIVTLNIHRTDTPMNIMDEKFMKALDEAVNKALKESDLTGVILTSDKPEFIAGADLAMLGKIKSEQDGLKIVTAMDDVFRKMETSGKPFVAAINGTALGGGFEVCLACHYRVLLDNPKIQVGLPEVSLGLLPGAGGTQRLSRMLGYQKATPILAQGLKFRPDKALKEGLVDALAADANDLLAQAKNWILANPSPTKAWYEKGFKIPGGALHTPKGYQFFAAATSMLKEKTLGNYPAPETILSCVYEGLSVTFEEGLKLESQKFAKLAADKTSELMIRTLFFGMNACNKGAARPKDFPPFKVNKVGMLGAGMMGAGIAYATASAGIPIVLKDVTLESAEKGKAYSEKILDKDIARGRSTEEKKAKLLGLIQPTIQAKDVFDCDLVIEAVFEDRDLKAKVTQECEQGMNSSAVFASNTSTLPITGLAKASKRPKNFIGLHFFSPVDKMPLVEIILGEETSQEALALCIDYCKHIRKTPIVVNDGRGFYTSRVFKTYVEEGIACLHDGVEPALIENAGRKAGMAVGPLCVADEVSIDLMHHIYKQTKEDLGDIAVDKNIESIINLFVNDLKRLGRKSGGGFYDYPKDCKKHLWPELTKHFAVKPEANDYEHVQMRLMYRQVVEAIRCLEENILTSARDGDVGSILGWGFPAFCGGALSYMEYVGADLFLENMKSLQDKYGQRFAPPKLLVDVVKGTKSFYEL